LQFWQRILRKKKLLEAGADVNRQRTDNGNTSLSLASDAGSAKCVRLCLDAAVDVKSAQVNKSFTAACRLGHTECVRTFVTAGVNANGSQALLGASRNGHADVVKVLLQAKAEVSGTDQGALCLSVAMQNDHEAVCELLIAHGASMA